jgi:hypothetical protein
VGVQDSFNGHRASKLCSNLLLMTAPWRLFWSWDGCVLSYPCQVLGINSVHWLTQSAVQGMQVQVLARAEEACQIYDPTTKLIILCRSPKTLFWDSCGRYCKKKKKKKISTIKKIPTCLLTHFFSSFSLEIFCEGESVKLEKQNIKYKRTRCKRTITIAIVKTQEKGNQGVEMIRTK